MVIDPEGNTGEVILSGNRMSLVVYANGYWCLWVTTSLKRVEVIE